MKISEKEFKLMNAVATSKSNDVKGKVPKNKEDAGMPWYNLDEFAEASGLTKEEVETISNTLQKRTFLEVVEPENGEDEVYCFLTEKGFAEWQKLHKATNKETTKKVEKKVEGAKPKKEKKEKKKKETKEKMPEKNGYRRPRPGGKCAEIWDACDDMLKKNKGKCPARKDVVATLGEAYNKITVGIQFRAWAIYNGVYAPRPRKTKKDQE